MAKQANLRIFSDWLVLRARRLLSSCLGGLFFLFFRLFHAFSATLFGFYGRHINFVVYAGKEGLPWNSRKVPRPCSEQTHRWFRYPHEAPALQSLPDRYAAWRR